MVDIFVNVHDRVLFVSDIYDNRKDIIKNTHCYYCDDKNYIMKNTGRFIKCSNCDATGGIRCPSGSQCISLRSSGRYWCSYCNHGKGFIKKCSVCSGLTSFEIKTKEPCQACAIYKTLNVVQ